MRILYTHLYDDHFAMGGAGQVVYDIANAMKNEYGHDVHCAVNGKELLTALSNAGLVTTVLDYSKLKTLYTLNQMKRAVNEFNPEIIHSHHRYTTFLADLFLKNKAVIIHTEHAFRSNKKALFRYGHYATGVSEAVRDQLVSHYGVQQDHAIAIPNAVSLRSPDAEEVARLENKYRKTPKQLIALCVGRFDEQKGHKYLLDAVGLLSTKDQKQIKFLLAGEGSLERMLRLKGEKMGILDCFEFLGHSTVIPELLKVCDFLVLPSLYEGMPLSVLEAFSVGKTALATDIAGTKEVITHEHDGLLVPPKDPKRLSEALHKIINNRGLIPSLSKESQKTYEMRFSFKKMMNRYQSLYERVLSDRSGR